MKKLFFVTNHNALTEEITAGFSKAFRVVTVPFDWDVITTSYQEEKPDLLVVNVKNMDNKQYRVLNDSLDFLGEQSKAPVLIGSRDEEDLVKRLLKTGIEYTDLLGMKMDEVVERLSRMTEKKKVMVVDDDPLQLRNMSRMLKEKYEVFVAPSGILAMTLLGKKVPDLILLDYEMPVCDGPQTLAMIRAEEMYREIPVIFLTGVSSREKIMRILEYKPQGYLLKTLPPAEVVKQIDAFFEKDETPCPQQDV